MDKTIRRPSVVEAYLMHNRTPLITEKLVDGRIRKISRIQDFNRGGWKREEMRLIEIYGDRWTGIKQETVNRYEPVIAEA